VVVMSTTRVIRIESSVNIASVESLFAELDKGTPCDVLVPTHLRKRLIGGDCALIQFLMTWAKRYPNGRVLTHIKETEDPVQQLPDFLERDHGLVANLAGSDIVTRRAEKSLRPYADSLARERLLRMEQGVPSATRGEKSFLLCADDTDKAYLPLFYHRTVGTRPKIKGEQDFRILAAELLRNTAQKRSTEEPLEDLKCNLGTILHELFDNTEKWARTEFDSRPVQRSLRGIRFEMYANKRDVLLGHVEGSPPLVNYVSREAFLRPGAGDDRQRFVEISIFDSGPGLAQRKRGVRIDSTVPIADEYRIVLECLSKHSSSSFHTHRGLGLHTVMKTLNDSSGFLRLRTGRLNLFRDFVADPYVQKGDRRLSEPYLLDWDSGTEELVPKEVAEGALFTMLIPIRLFR